MGEEQVLTYTRSLSDVDRAAPCEVEVIRDIDGFDRIGEEFDRFVEECGVNGLFLSHAWFRTWWEAFGARHQLHIVTVRARQRLIGVAPMMRTRARIHRIGAQALYAIHNPHSPRYDFIVSPHDSGRVYQAIWSELASHSDCELIVLPQVPVESRTLGMMGRLAEQDGWLAGRWIAPVSPFIRLDTDYQSYIDGLRPACRVNLRKRYARLRRLGVVDVEIVTDRAAVENAMRDGLRIEAAAWKGQQGTAMASNKAVADFYVRLAERQADLGNLRLSFLRLGGKRIAFNYLLREGKKLYALKIGYDPEYHAYSPGNMLLNLILKDAFSMGIEEYDLLGGDDEWKFEWAQHERGHRWLFLFRNRFRPRLLHGLKFGVTPRVKKYVSLFAKSETLSRSKDI